MGLSDWSRILELEDALRRIVKIGQGPFDREMAPGDRWLPALNTCVQIAEEALEDA